MQIINLIKSNVGSSAVIGINVLVWLFQQNYNINLQNVTSSYEQFITLKEYWRAITATFSHISIVHLLFNCISLWNMKSLESMIGLVKYFKYNFILIITCELLSYLLIHLTSLITKRLSLSRFSNSKLIKYFIEMNSDIKNVGHLGYSGVAFGLIVLISYHSKMDRWILSPLSSLLLTHIIIPNASFVGHTSGILCGLLIVLMELSNNFQQYFLLVTVVATIFIYMTIKKSDTDLISIFTNRQQQKSVQIKNGVIITNAKSEDIV